MTIIYVTENNCDLYGITARNNGMIKVQNVEDVSNNKNLIYEVNPMETFLGKIHLCDMTEPSGAKDKEVFNGNFILLKVSEENIKHRYIYIGGDMVCSFLTNDRIYKDISNMGNNSTPCSLAIGYENICYLTPYFIFIKNDNIDVDDIHRIFDYDVSNCEKIRVYKIHSNYDVLNFLN